MQIVDANLLIYAVNSSADEHRTARTWLDESLAGTEPVGFAWIALLAFLRLTTRPGLFPAPLTLEAALTQVETWLAQPAAVIVHPTARHLPVLHGLLEPLGTAANLVNDAHLAALAVEYGARIISFDHDFGRFTGVRWAPPGPRPGC